MEIHPDIGADPVEGLEMDTHVVDIVRHEHEHWHGRGYPHGLEGDQIPMGARIIAIADAYHALTTDRPYRSAYPREQAMDILKAERGTHSDPNVVDAFQQFVNEDRGRYSESDSASASDASSSSH